MFAVYAINKIYDLLVAGNVAGQALDYFTKIYFEAKDQVATNADPFLWIKFDDPAFTEEWSTAQNGKTGPLNILILVHGRIKDKETYPYGVPGDATKRSPMIMAGDVMNYLDMHRADILGAAAGKLVDMNLTLNTTTVDGENSYFVIIRVEIKTRVFAGAR
jgi:hypothetical protein